MVVRTISKRDEAKHAKQVLLDAICEANSCRYVWAVSGRGRDAREAHVIVGYEGQARFCELLFHSALLQMALGRTAALRAKTDGTSRYVFVRSFCEAFAMQARSRILRARDTASTGKELVLVGRKAEVDAFADGLGETEPGRKVARYETSGEALLAGAEAADRADLSGGRNNLEG